MIKDDFPHMIDESLRSMRNLRVQPEQRTFQGKKNIYVCPDCLDHVVTVDRHEGVTPFMIACQRTEGCKGMMESSFYRVFDIRMKAEYEWYAPTDQQMQNENPAVQDHVKNGGLLMRKIDD